MADKTLKMWLQHVNSQVAEILNDYSRVHFSLQYLTVVICAILLFTLLLRTLSALLLCLLLSSFLLLSFFCFLFFGRAAVSGEDTHTLF